MKNKIIQEFSHFLEENKKSLSEYELGKAYLEIQSCQTKLRKLINTIN